MYSDLIFLEMMYWFLCMNFAAWKVREYKYLYDENNNVFGIIRQCFVFVVCTVIAPIGAVIDLFRG